MGFRYNKRIKIAPGIRLNVSKNGVSTSFGPRGASVTVGKRGVRANVGIPGTGISYSQQLTSRTKRPQRLVYESVATPSPDISQNIQEVQKYDAYVNMLTSVHLECEENVDWHEISNEDISYLKNIGPNVTDVQNELANYKPTFRDRMFNRVDAKKALIEQKLDNAQSLDKELFLKKQRIQNLATKIVNRDLESWILALDEFDPFDDIKEFGSNVEFNVHNNELEVQLSIGNEKVVPTDVVSLTSTNKLSRKNMGKTKYLALYQDYICSCVIRIAREVFAILPADQVLINVYDFGQADEPYERGCILSTRIYQNDLATLDFEYIDCSDTIENFEHNMKYLKTKGFRIVEELI